MTKTFGSKTFSLSINANPKTDLIAARTLSDSLEIGDNIFVTYHESKSAQVVAGNGVVRKA